MNMKRIVFVAVGILIMLAIMGFTLHSMSHIDELNQKHRDQQKGEALASRMVTTAVTTSIWDSLRPTETEAVTPEETSENPEQLPESGTEPEFSAVSESPENPENPDMFSQNQTFTETVSDPVILN